MPPPPLRIGRRSVAVPEGLRLRSSQGVGQGGQPNLLSPAVHRSGVLQRPRAQPTRVIPIQAGAEALRPALVEANPVFQVRRMLRRSLSTADSFAQERQTSALKRGQADGMLGNDPRRTAPVRTDFRTLRPAFGVENRSEFAGVFNVHPLHFGRVAVEQRTITRKTRSGFLVAALEEQELVHEVGAHRSSFVGVERAVLA